MMIHLIRDVLDSAVLDSGGRVMGRVDSIVLDARDDEPPRVVALEIGPSPLGYRLHERLGRWIDALERRFGVAAHRPVRIAPADVRDVGPELRIALSIRETAALNVEDRLREVIWNRRGRAGRREHE
jgi:hypothetical protein